jgi:hypothetical protein
MDQDESRSQICEPRPHLTGKYASHTDRSEQDALLATLCSTHMEPRHSTGVYLWSDVASHLGLGGRART